MAAADSAVAPAPLTPRAPAPVRDRQAASRQRLRFSVIVPVYEDWDCIPTLLSHLAAQTVPRAGFEILLVDNGSSNFAPPARIPANVRILGCDKPGSYAARNHGIEQARGEWLVFTDADCQPRPTWLESLCRRADRTNGTPTLLAGSIAMVSHRDAPCVYEIYDLVRGIPQAWYVSRGYATTANLAVPAVLARRIGRFDDTRYSGADADYCRWAATNGVQLSYVPDATVAHPARDSWTALVRKARRIKGGHLISGARRKRLQYWLRTFMPPVIAIGRFLRQSDHPMRYRLIAVLVHLRVWGVEMREALRLLVASGAERR